MNQLFITRQNKVFEFIEEDSCIFISSGSIKYRNNDVSYPFRPSSNFYYLTGLDEPDLILFMCKTKSHIRSYIFIKDPPKEKRIWDNIHQLSVDSDELSYYHVHRIDDLAKVLNQYDMCLFYTDVYSLPNLSAVSHKKEFRFADKIIAELRLVKDSFEISLIEKAAEFSSEVFRSLLDMHFSNEGEIEAYWVSEGLKRGLSHQAYQPIIAGGSRGTILHYRHSHNSLKHDRTVLIDAGFEYKYYASDITRVLFLQDVPSIHLELYQLVALVQKNVIANVYPGQTLHRLQQITLELLSSGLKELGVFQGSVEKIINEDIKSCYMHSIGHHLGLDVHDCSALVGLKDRELTEGNVITIEPGLYFSPDTFHSRPELSGFAVRIEDDLCLTKTHHKILSSVPI